MIYPTRSAVLAAAAGAPVALLIGVMLPARWYAGLAWPVAVLLLAVVDALSGARRGEATLAPLGSASGGATVDAKITVRVRGNGAPGAAQVALAGNELLGFEDDGRW